MTYSTKAIILFKSFKTRPQVAAKKAVEAPIKVIINSALELNSSIGEDLTNKYKPAVTRVQFLPFISKRIGLNLYP